MSKPSKHCFDINVCLVSKLEDFKCLSTSSGVIQKNLNSVDFKIFSFFIFD